MWQRDSYNKQMMLQLGPAIPLHVGSFLKLGLQPELSERREIDLQEIYLMLRLQAAAISHIQQKETYSQRSSPSASVPVRMTSSTPIPLVFAKTQIQPQHEWDAVKERMKKMNPPPPPPPLPPPLPTASAKEKVQEVSEESLDGNKGYDEEINQSDL